MWSCMNCARRFKTPRVFFVLSLRKQFLIISRRVVHVFVLIDKRKNKKTAWCNTKFTKEHFITSVCVPLKELLTQVNGTTAVKEDFTKKLGVKSNFEAAERVLEPSSHWVCMLLTLALICGAITRMFTTRTIKWVNGTIKWVNGKRTRRDSETTVCW